MVSSDGREGRKGKHKKIVKKKQRSVSVHGSALQDDQRGVAAHVTKLRDMCSGDGLPAWRSPEKEG